MSALDLIGTADAAEILGVSSRTVKRLARAGELPYTIKMPGDTGAYLFLRRDVERIRDQRATGPAA
jgi:excisionase family DNA binding protein